MALTSTLRTTSNVIMAGVVSGADLGDVKGRTTTVNRMKRDLPQAVTALVKEAMSVLCLQEAPAPLHSGLIAKLAEYVREDEEDISASGGARGSTATAAT